MASKHSFSAPRSSTRSMLKQLSSKLGSARKVSTEIQESVSAGPPWSDSVHDKLEPLLQSTSLAKASTCLTLSNVESCLGQLHRQAYSCNKSGGAYDLSQMAQEQLSSIMSEIRNATDGLRANANGTFEARLRAAGRAATAIQQAYEFVLNVSQQIGWVDPSASNAIPPFLLSREK